MRNALFLPAVASGACRIFFAATTAYCRRRSATPAAACPTLRSDGFAPARACWANRSAETEKPMRDLLTLKTTCFQYLHGASCPVVTHGIRPAANKTVQEEIARTAKGLAGLAAHGHLVSWNSRRSGVRIRRLPGSVRDHGGGRSGTWSQRSDQHVANDSLPDELQNITPTPQQRQHWLSANVCLIHQ